MRASVLNPSISHCMISVCAAGNKQKGLLNLQFRGRQLLFALSLLKGLSPRLFPAAQRELPAHCLIRSVRQNRAQLSKLTFSAIICQPKPTKSSLKVRQAVFSSPLALLRERCNISRRKILSGCWLAGAPEAAGTARAQCPESCINSAERIVEF